MKYLRYLRYIFLHKWFVFVAGLRTKAPILNLIVHDLSKFRRDEFFPYADYFYDKPLQEKEKKDALEFFTVDSAAPFGYHTKDRFNKAWLLHQRRNPHHWQFWLLLNDDGTTIPLPMPDELACEMVADWLGAGRTLTGEWGAKEWYLKNRDHIMLHPDTEFIVEVLLEIKE